MDPESLKGVIHSDGPLKAGEFNMELAGLLRNAGPWGQGFPEPLFDGGFEVINERVVGEKHLKLVLRPEQGGELLDGIAFNQAEYHAGKGLDRVHAAFRLDINEFREAIMAGNAWGVFGPSEKAFGKNELSPAN